MTSRLLSIGVAAPESRLDTDRFLALARNLSPADSRPDVIEHLARRTEIEERGCCIFDGAGRQSLFQPDQSGRGPGTAERMRQYSTWATALAVAASTEAIERAMIEPAAITHVVTASCTGFEAPGFDQALIRELRLRPTVRRAHVGFMGCHAAVNALAVAGAFAESDPSAVVLVCCAEVCSLHYHFGGRVDQMISNALFADGAGAAIVCCRGPADAPMLAGCSAALFPNSEDLMTWRIGDHGFEMSLSALIPESLGRLVPEWARAALDAHGLSARDVGGWAIHPGGPRIVRVVAESLGLSPEHAAPSLETLRAHGNMSSPTILFILRALWDGGTPRPWVGMAFGPGLAGELIVLR